MMFGEWPTQNITLTSSRLQLEITEPAYIPNLMNSFLRGHCLAKFSFLKNSVGSAAWEFEFLTRAQPSFKFIYNRKGSWIQSDEVLFTKFAISSEDAPCGGEITSPTAG